MATFLFKTEPADYSFDHLQRDKRAVWTGVANPAARITLRTVAKGDQVLIYHTGDDKAIVGIAKAITAAYADPDQPGLNDRGEAACPVVDLAPVRALKRPIRLAEIKATPACAQFALVKQSRLSVMPVPIAVLNLLMKMESTPA